MSNEEGSLVN